jgi:hypothetical protein
MTDALIKVGRPDTLHTLHQPIAFLHVHYSILISLIKTVRCSILILSIKTVHCSILILSIKTVHCSIVILLIKTVRCSIPHCIFSFATTRVNKNITTSTELTSINRSSVQLARHNYYKPLNAVPGIIQQSTDNSMSLHLG